MWRELPVVQEAGVAAVQPVAAAQEIPQAFPPLKELAVGVGQHHQISVLVAAVGRRVVGQQQ